MTWNAEVATAELALCCTWGLSGCGKKCGLNKSTSVNILRWCMEISIQITPVHSARCTQILLQAEHLQKQWLWFGKGREVAWAVTVWFGKGREVAWAVTVWSVDTRGCHPSDSQTALYHPLAGGAGVAVAESSSKGVVTRATGYSHFPLFAACVWREQGWCGTLTLTLMVT